MPGFQKWDDDTSFFWHDEKSHVIGIEIPLMEFLSLISRSRNYKIYQKMKVDHLTISRWECNIRPWENTLLHYSLLWGLWLDSTTLPNSDSYHILNSMPSPPPTSWRTLTLDLLGIGTRDVGSWINFFFLPCFIEFRSEAGSIAPNTI